MNREIDRIHARPTQDVTSRIPELIGGRRGKTLRIEPLLDGRRAQISTAHAIRERYCTGIGIIERQRDCIGQSALRLVNTGKGPAAQYRARQARSCPRLAFSKRQLPQSAEHKSQWNVVVRLRSLPEQVVTILKRVPGAASI